MRGAHGTGHAACKSSLRQIRPEGDRAIRYACRDAATRLRLHLVWRCAAASRLVTCSQPPQLGCPPLPIVARPLLPLEPRASSRRRATSASVKTQDMGALRSLATPATAPRADRVQDTRRQRACARTGGHREPLGCRRQTAGGAERPAAGQSLARSNDGEAELLRAAARKKASGPALPARIKALPPRPPASSAPSCLHNQGQYTDQIVP
jgi:hypothetical protein